MPKRLFITFSCLFLLAIPAFIRLVTVPVYADATATDELAASVARGLAAPVTPKPATRLSLKPLQNKATAYGLVELNVETDGLAANPFDPAQVDLRVRFTSATSKTMVVPAFWYQDFNPSTVQPKGTPVWRVRFTPTEAGQWRAQAELEGFTTVYDEEFPVRGVDNWRPYAENIRRAGVEVLHVMGTAELLAPLMRTMSDVGYFPRYITLQGNLYDPAVITEAGSLLDRSTVLIDGSIVPFEVAKPGSATAQYVDILQRYVPGAKPKALGVSGWSAFLLFATAAARCGSQLTRACVLQRAAGAGMWTGGGLHAPNVPANQLTAYGECSLTIQATSTGFVVSDTFTAPNRGWFNCDRRNAQRLPALTS